MKNFGAKWLALAAMSAVVAGTGLNGCGGGDDGTGTAGTGGGKGGTTGGAGKGGTTGTGGTAGGTGGAAGKGGTTGTGGVAGGTGGATGGAGGAGGAGGGLPCPGLATFDTTVEGFALNTFAGTGNLANAVDGGTVATAAFNATEGNPSPGSVKIDAPFSDYNQYVDLQKNLGASALKNWSSNTALKVRVKVASGGNQSPQNPMGIQPYINTGTTYVYCGGYTNLVAGNGWNEYTLDLSTCAAAADKTMVIAFGVSITAGNGQLGNDAGTNTTKPIPAVIYVDSFYLTGGSCGTGSGGAGGGTGGAGGAGGRGGSAGGAGGATGGAGGATGGAGGATGGAGGRGGSAGGAGGATGGAGGATGGAGGATGGAGGATGGAGGATGGAGGATGGAAGGAGGATGGAAGGASGSTGGSA